MIDRLIALALNQRATTVLLILAIVVLGFYSVLTLPTDSFPDVSNVQVQIITEPSSMATEEVESLVTVPIEYALNGLPFVQKVRSSSEFGLSVVTAIFDDRCDVYLARQLVAQRLDTLTFPPGVPRPQLGPVVSSFSQVFMYYLVSKDSNFIDLRTTQDWVIAKRLLSVPGVGNVVSYGGWVKQYQVIVDHDKLRSYRFTLKDVTDAIARSNQNVGGNFIENGDEEVIIRGLGRVDKLADLENIVLRAHDGTPVFLKSVAAVQIGPALRRGSSSMNGKGEAVIGIVLTRKGTNTKEVVEKVEQCLEEINKELPPGIKAVPFYNQKELVDKTMDTVREILLFSGGLVIVILSAILLDLTAASIVVIVIPLSLLFSFIMMKFTGLSSNLMTLGAVDFGVVVDAGVVVVENIYRRLSEAYADRADDAPPVDRLRLILSGAQEVGRPVSFAIMIIVAVYLPLFALEGIEGKMFQPLALTFIYAIVGALLISLTVLPVLCYWFLRGKVREKHNPVVEGIRKAYIPLLHRCLGQPKLISISALAILLVTAPLMMLVGSEFIPTLDEGSLFLRMHFPPSISHTKTIEFSGDIEKWIRSFPEVTVVVTRVGRSGMGSDVEGVDAADMFIGLKPKEQWADKNKEHLIDRMAKQVSKVPGLMFSFSQPIADMVDDLVTGIKADVGIKIFGPDLATLDSLAHRVRLAVGKIRGTADLSREPLIGSPQLNIAINREQAARYGLLVGDVQEVVEAALAGTVVSEVIEDTRRFEVLVRMREDQRNRPDKIGNLTVKAPTGAQLKLKALAAIDRKTGALFVNRENGQRRAAVMVNIRGRDLGSWVQEAQAVVAKEVSLPPGYRIVWGGQFENQQRAMSRLAIVVPIVLFLIFLLLYFTFSSVKNAALIMLNVPFATTGGILGLWLTQQPLSVPAIIGFIAVFGVAVQNGVILTSCMMQLQKHGISLETAIINGATMRLRPVLMTATVAMMGLLPKLFFDGTGAEIQRPLATVVFGGLFTSTLITLFVLPTIYKVINTDRDRSEPAAPATPDEVVSRLRQSASGSFKALEPRDIE